MISRPSLVFLLAAASAWSPLLAQTPQGTHGQGPQIRVGLDQSQTEHIVSLEGGGEVIDRVKGRVLMRLKDGEKLRLWFDAKGEADGGQDYRVQVGPAVTVAQAEALMARLKTLGEAPERFRVSDGDTWRVVTGRFETVDAADPILKKLQDSGYEELWVSSESRPKPLHKGRALYAVTERYERRALPIEGVAFRPKNELVKIEGKGRYRGRTEIFPNPYGKLTLVNQVDMETYLRGVVPREMGAWEYPHLEALKAQAVAARTYAAANLGKRTKEGFDLLDTVADQVYGGRDGEQSLTDRAVKETEGLIATYNGRPIQALFMASCGGHTIDNTFVFGGDQGYLAAATCYPEKPVTRTFTSGAHVPESTDGMTVELLRLAAFGLIKPEQLDPEALKQPAKLSDLRPAVDALRARLNLGQSLWKAEPASLIPVMAKVLGFEEALQGQERGQDATYFGLAPDARVSAYLVRRGICTAAQLQSAPTLGVALQALGRLWQELEPLEWNEGTLLLDGQVRRKKAGPEPFPLAPEVMIAEEWPGGMLRLVAKSEVQVGDRFKWLGNGQGAKLVVRRLDPDGAAWDRYNPTSHWRVEVTEAELVSKMRARVKLQSVRGLRLQRNAEGRVTELTVLDEAGTPHRFTGMRIRGLLGLKDNVFGMIPMGTSPNRRWVFLGRGWGHGVGMCQTGAYGMAMEGVAFEDILKHYYRGISLEKAQGW
jgi:stage II sporulation protein D